MARVEPITVKVTVEPLVTRDTVGSLMAEALLAAGRLVNLFELRPELVPVDGCSLVDALLVVARLERIEHAARLASGPCPCC